MPRFCVFLLALLTFSVGARAQSAAGFGFEYRPVGPVVQGTDTLRNAWAGGLNTPQFSTIDLDGDGQLDLFAFDHESSRCYTFLSVAEPGSTAGRRWQYTPQYESIFPADLQSWALLRDYDCDGRPDLFTYINGGEIRVFRNVLVGGRPSFQLATNQIRFSGSFAGTANLTIGGYNLPAIQDVNGDGKLDIMAYDFASASFIEQYINTSPGTCGGALTFTLTEELVRREEQFRFLAESVPQIVWTSYGVGGNDYINQRWYDYTGLVPVDANEGANWAAAIHPDDLGPTNQRWQQSVTTGEFFEIEYRFRRHDGVYRWFLGQGRPQRHSDGHILKWFGTCTDIEDQKRVQQELESQNARLMRTNEDLDNFVYTASHDLKQPINNMAGIFEELTRTAYFRDPDAIKLISYFERALGQIFATIDNLGAIVQVQRQQQETPPENVALAPLVAEVINSLQDQVVQAGATFELDFATCPMVSFVRVNLQSVFFNLISNSLKYAFPGRPPVIHLRSTPDMVTGRPTLTVQDNGLGIDLERFGPQLFQLFRRFHTHVGGTGMGLYLVNRIVQNHSGRLEGASTVDEGTTFQIYL